MALRALIEEVRADVNDVLRTSFLNSSTRLVPNSDDPDLTFERNVEKRGKEIETCVLYIDIRNSVDISASVSSTVMGKIYTAFIKAAIKIGRYHGGSTRNIIGDRVMIVFPTNDCFYNSISCAITLNYVAKQILKSSFPKIDFRCGIGIDYGQLRVIKVGIQRNGIERAENKGLVWSGIPANLASRLTDIANKKVQDEQYEVVLYPNRPRIRFSYYPKYGAQKPDLYTSPYLPHTQTIRMSVKDFAEQFQMLTNGEVFSTKGKLVSFKKVVSEIEYPPILVTDRVRLGLVSQPKNLASVIWKEQVEKIKNVDCKVFGCDINWNI